MELREFSNNKNTNGQEKFLNMFNTFIILEKKIKTNLRSHLTWVRVAKIKKKMTRNAFVDMEEGEHLFFVGGSAHWCSHCGNQYVKSHKRLEIYLPRDPTLPLLGIFLKDSVLLPRYLSSMIIAALFTITRKWKQPWYPSDDEYDNETVVDICRRLLFSYKGNQIY